MRVRRAPGDDFSGACPFHGDCVEGLISGPALAKRFGRPGHELPDGGDEWDLFVHDLAGLLHNLVVTAAPERIAIGGGVLASRERLFPKLRAALAASIAAYGSLAPRPEERRVGTEGVSTCRSGWCAYI